MPKQHNSVLEEDRRLAGAIEKHPCLYNRNMEEFNDVNCVRNAWEEISSELDFDVGKLKNIPNLHHNLISRLIII